MAHQPTRVEHLCGWAGGEYVSMGGRDAEMTLAWKPMTTAAMKSSQENYGVDL